MGALDDRMSAEVRIGMILGDKHGWSDEDRALLYWTLNRDGWCVDKAIATLRKAGWWLS